jgi:hypothetical protein
MKCICFEKSFEKEIFEKSSERVKEEKHIR